MQKKLIALAVAGLTAAPAFAQSNVTVYGILDAAVAYGKSGDTTYTGLQNGVLSGNRFGLKGSEDLGNGLSAVFTLEQGFSVGSGQPDSSRQFHRQSYAGLKGGFGTIALGRQYAPGYLWTARITNALGAGAYEPQEILTNSIKGNGIEASIHPASDARWDNSISYDTGDMGGLNVRVIYSFQGTMSEVDGGPDASDDDKIGLGVAYNAGPLKVGLVYHKSKGADEDMDEIYLAGAYDLGVVALNASVQQAKMDDNAAAGITEVDTMVYTIGATVPVGPGTFHVAVGQLSDDVTDDNDSTSASIGYTQSLSKRTNVTFAVNHTTNDDNASRGVLVSEAGDGSTSVAAGLRHTF
ncbi:MAG: porin [Rhodocyclaceae bacterium]|nr:porin [Rhodocyclaceae bacterium]